MLRKVLFAGCIALMAASAASAATITYTLDFSAGGGTFKLYADASTGDNFGIASYGAVLTGPVTTFDHSSVNTLASSGPSGVGSAGFTLLRSADNAPTILASQDTTSATANLIRGIGQTAGSLASNGITSFINPVEGDPWLAHFLIGSGTFTGSTDGISINKTSADTFSNLYSAQSGNAVTGASTVNVVRVEVPEPATLTMFGLAVVGCVGVIRRRRAA